MDRSGDGRGQAEASAGLGEGLGAGRLGGEQEGAAGEPCWADGLAGGAGGTEGDRPPWGGAGTVALNRFALADLLSGAGTGRAELRRQRQHARGA